MNLGKLRAAITRILDYRQHENGCDINRTDFCSCGLREAMTILDAEWKKSGQQLAAALRTTEALREALIAARQFLDPEVDRGPVVDGWQNTVDLVDAALAAGAETP